MNMDTIDQIKRGTNETWSFSPDGVSFDAYLKGRGNAMRLARELAATSGMAVWLRSGKQAPVKVEVAA